MKKIKEKREQEISTKDTKVLTYRAGLPVSTTSWSVLFILYSNTQLFSIVAIYENL